MENMNYFDCVKEMIELQKSALDKIKKQLDEIDENDAKINKWFGRETDLNDRRMYMGISYTLNNNVYLINTFSSEIDINSGNCHSQLGRIQFVHKLNNKKPASTNNKISKKKLNTLINSCTNKKNELTSLIEFESNEESTIIEFCFTKWKNPLTYFNANDNLFTADKCINRKWITVDDIIQNQGLPKLIATAFIEFINISEKENIKTE